MSKERPDIPEKKELDKLECGETAKPDSIEKSGAGRDISPASAPREDFEQRLSGQPPADDNSSSVQLGEQSISNDNSAHSVAGQAVPEASHVDSEEASEQQKSAKPSDEFSVNNPNRAEGDLSKNESAEPALSAASSPGPAETSSDQFEPDMSPRTLDAQPEVAAPNGSEEVDKTTLKGLVIEPSEKEVKPGESISFQVQAETKEDTLVKVANAQWTAQGGEIDEKGVYEAGTAAGKYDVTAKAGSLSATAQVTIAVPKPTWKVLDPEDQSDPVDHEVHDMWMRDKDWRIVAASVRGKLHAHKALWRDDAYSVDWVDDWTIVAVGDGAGSAKLSRIGSRIACAAAVASLKGLLEDFAISRSGDDVPKDKDLQKLKAFLVLAASEARNKVVREAHDRGCNLKDLSTTLLVAVHAPCRKKHLVASVQVGDGAIGVYDKNGDCTVLGVADHGEFSSETVFLTSGSELIKKPLDQRVLFTLKPDVQCIGVMCDGVADDFFPEEKRLVQLFDGDPIQELQTGDGGPVQGVMKSVIPSPRDGAALQDWLKYEKKGSSDDRTLVLLYRR